jgi:hypothetical protein
MAPTKRRIFGEPRRASLLVAALGRAPAAPQILLADHQHTTHERAQQ